MSVCVDASLVLKWLTPEEGSEAALRLCHRWLQEETLLLAPSLIDYEVGTAIRQKILRRFLQADDLFLILEMYRKLGLQLLHPVDLVSQGVAAAAALNQASIYDVSYLLVAKQQGIDLVTADKRFFEASRSLFPFVRYYKDLT